MTFSEIKELQNELKDRIYEMRDAIKEAEEFFNNLPHTVPDYAETESEDLALLVADIEAFLKATEQDG